MTITTEDAQRWFDDALGRFPHRPSEDDLFLLTWKVNGRDYEAVGKIAMRRFAPVNEVFAAMNRLRLVLEGAKPRIGAAWVQPWPEQGSPSLAELVAMLDQMGAEPVSPPKRGRGHPGAEWHWAAKMIAPQVERMLEQIGYHDKRPAKNPNSTAAVIAARAVAAYRGIHDADFDTVQLVEALRVRPRHKLVRTDRSRANSAE